jgi:glycine/D-amino acid oxidase-like deaminating enzyme
MYHTLIVGGGLAGLQVAEALAKKGDSVLLLEKYPSFGGRAVTYRDDKDGLQYEIGAGRIFHAHKRVAALVKRFGLHTYPIGIESNYEHEPNPFNDLFEPIRAALMTADPKDLALHTIRDLVPEALHPILKMYPYTAELGMMRADVALPLFAAGETMGKADTPTAGGTSPAAPTAAPSSPAAPTAAPSSPAAPTAAPSSPAAPYYGIVEGIDRLATGLADAATKAGATLQARHRVHDITRAKDGLFEVQGDYGKKAEAKPFLYKAERVIIATCRCSLSDFTVLKGTPLLKQLGTSALIRIYAVFPPDSRGAVWFDGLPKTVTAGPLRYVIPIDAKKGLIMISYTDGPDTEIWRALEGKALEERLLKEARVLFPDKVIPAPIFLKKHDWPSGCTYWLPGDYSVAAASLAAHNPAPGIYVVGESVSTEQAWMEGALQSAETLTNLLTSHSRS